ncbi:MAG: hypothetical protein LH624_08350 [Cryobacterium sp.]|nr:hypothetical protein [Cryobacterium sp.]
MALINSAQPADGASLVTALGRHALQVWRDPSFQAVLKREAWQFVVNVSAEARAVLHR